VRNVHRAVFIGATPNPTFAFTTHFAKFFGVRGGDDVDPGAKDGSCSPGRRANHGASRANHSPDKAALQAQ